MTQLAKEMALFEMVFNKAFSPMRNPSSDTVQKVVKSFGLNLDVVIAA